MADDGIEHHTEVRRERRSASILVLVAGLLVLAAAIWAARAGGDAVTDVTPTTGSSTPADTRPTRLPVVHVVADTADGPRPATTADGPGAGRGSTFEAIQATPIATDGQVVVLVDGGTVLAGRSGEVFRPVGPAPSSALVASNEPGHVWVVAPEDELLLVALEGLDPGVRIPLGGDRVLGPAPFGVVTVAGDGAVSWRRPSFDPAPLPTPDGLVGVDAGGDAVLLQGASTPDGAGRLEVRSVTSGSLLRTFESGSVDRPAALATDGSALAAPAPTGWIVHDVASGAQRGSLPAAPGIPVWIGDGRFALLVDGTVVVSDGTELSPPWRLRALAERSP